MITQPYPANHRKSRIILRTKVAQPEETESEGEGGLAGNEVLLYGCKGKRSQICHFCQLTKGPNNL